MFRRLLSLDQARKAILDRLKPAMLGNEQISLLHATNRVLAEDVVATRNVPPFDRSTVDGYAVKAEDTFGAAENRPVTLSVCGTVRIGELPKTTVGKKQAAEIVTGAPMPKGADTVVMVEYTEKKEEEIHVYSAVAKHENVMKAGSDIKKGERMLECGTTLSSREIGVLAALGIDSVRVRRVPRVAVLSTGPELTEPGKTLSPGKIFDTNAYSLSSAILESGGEPIYSGVVEDSLSELQEALRKTLTSADMIVTSGGVSVGPKDLMPKALASLGTPGVIFSGIAIKPGKPTTFAVIDGKPLFSLPGHPTSALLVFHLLVRPAINLMTNGEPENDLKLETKAGARMFSAKGRRTFVMVKLRSTKLHGILAEPVQGGESGATSPMAKADGFVEIPENVQFVDLDDRVFVHLFRSKTFCF